MKRAHVTNKLAQQNLATNQGHRLVRSVKPVGWDQRRFAAPAHHEFSPFPVGGPALEASLSHPTLNKAMALADIAAPLAWMSLSGERRELQLAVCCRASHQLPTPR